MRLVGLLRSVFIPRLYIKSSRLKVWCVTVAAHLPPHVVYSVYSVLPPPSPIPAYCHIVVSRSAPSHPLWGDLCGSTLLTDAAQGLALMCRVVVSVSLLLLLPPTTGDVRFP